MTEDSPAPTQRQSPLLNRATAYVLIVETGSSIRMMITEILRNLGFERFQAAANLKEALHYLESEDVHWVITPFLFDQPIHALHLLKLISQTSELKQTAVSLFMSEGELPYLGQAFELGALSWHPKAYARETMQAEFEGLLLHLEEHQGRPAFTAGEYLRRFLVAQKYFRSLLHLEEELLALSPGDPEQMLNLAEAELSLGRIEKGHNLLAQIVSIDEGLAPAVQVLEKKFPRVTQLSHSLKTVVIIDPDSDHCHSLAGILRKISGEEPHVFGNGLSALDWIAEAGEVDLIIMEWKIPGLSGPVLLQRLRKQLKLKTNIVIVSSLLKAMEKPLLKEMGVDDLFEKPLDSSSFLTKIIGTMQHKAFNSRRIVLENKIRRLLAARRIEEAQLDLPTLLDDPKVHESIKKEMLAEIDYQQGKYREALTLAIDALKLDGGPTLGLLNLAGKCFLRLQQYQSAIKCFERAKELSPINFERLFNLAECKLATEDPEAAEAELQLVKELDPSNSQLLEMQTKINLELGRKADPMTDLLSPVAWKRIASFINNRGVILVRSGRIEEGMALYERALKALPERALLDRSLVTYNLALAYARHSDFEAALTALLEIPASKNSTSPNVLAIFHKKMALKRHIEMLISKGEKTWPVDLPNDGDEWSEETNRGTGEGKAAAPLPETPASDWDTMMGKTIVKKGDIGCYLIFKYLDDDRTQIADRLNAMPRFVRR